MATDLRRYPDREQVCQAVAADLARRARDAVAAHGRFTLSLAGGTTPKRLFEILAADYRDTIPWQGVQVFWGDERYVAHDHPESNYGIANALLLQQVPIPGANVYPMPTDLDDPEAAAHHYEATLGNVLGPQPHFDLVLLGLGEDGHTASLFPGSPALREHERLVVAVVGPKPPPVRLTLTFAALNAASAVHMLVSGKGKAAALQQTLQGGHDPMAHPAQALQPDGELVWWADAEAAALLSPER